MEAAYIVLGLLLLVIAVSIQIQMHVTARSVYLTTADNVATFVANVIRCEQWVNDPATGLGANPMSEPVRDFIK